MLEGSQLKQALAAVGDLLEAADESVGIVVVGGASLSLLGLVDRTTGDVDVIACVDPVEDPQPGDEHPWILVPPAPMPEPLVTAARTVARDFDLPNDWMNAVIGAQWDLGLPPSLDTDLTWQTYGGLSVGLAGRETLITLKLFAAVDQGPLQCARARPNRT